MPTPIHSGRPQFDHEDTAINNFINFILDTPDIGNRAQLILMSGVMLENNELMGYACEIDPDVVDAVVPDNVMAIINGMFFPNGEPDQELVVE